MGSMSIVGAEASQRRTKGGGAGGGGGGGAFLTAITIVNRCLRSGSIN